MRTAVKAIPLIFAALLCVSPFGGAAAAGDTGQDWTRFIDRLDREMPGLLERYGAVGAAVALVRDGEVVSAKGYGFADREKAVPMTAGTVFQAASISKPVTAWAVMKLVEEGRLELDAPVETYLTRWHIPESGFGSEGVTVRRLLSHTAGLSLGGYPGYDLDSEIPALEESLSGNNSSGVPVYVMKEPGSEFDYSGGGYALLSLLVEEVTGETFEDYIKRDVLGPLGMDSSTYSWSEVPEGSMATGYGREGEPFPNYLFSAKGAASLYTTASDLAKYVAALVKAPGAPAGRGVLSPRTLAEMMSTQAETVGDISLFFDGMGLGYFIDGLEGGGRLVAHTGSNKGWRNIFALSPETGDGIVILTNSDAGRNLYVEVLGRWSALATGHAPRMVAFFRKTFRISLSLAAVLILLFLLWLALNIWKGSLSRRVPVWRPGQRPWWVSILRFVFLVFLPGTIVYFYYFVFHPILRDLSPLTSTWLLLGFLSCGAACVFSGLLPKRMA